METLKTVGDLRKLIQTNGGKIEIGTLVFTMDNETSDIDIKFENTLIQWFPKGTSNEDNLIMEGGFSTTSTFSDKDNVISATKKEVEEAKEKILELTTENEKLVKNYSENSNALGKVEAYEKLLIGRQLTISK